MQRKIGPVSKIPLQQAPINPMQPQMPFHRRRVGRVPMLQVFVHRTLDLFQLMNAQSTSRLEVLVAQTMTPMRVRDDKQIRLLWILSPQGIVPKPFQVLDVSVVVVAVSHVPDLKERLGSNLVAAYSIGIPSTVGPRLIRSLIKEKVLMNAIRNVGWIRPFMGQCVVDIYLWQGLLQPKGKIRRMLVQQTRCFLNGFMEPCKRVRRFRSGSCGR